MLKTLLRFPAELYLDSHRKPITRERLRADLEKVSRIAEVSVQYPDVGEALRFLEAENRFDVDDDVAFYLKAFENGEKRNRGFTGNP